MAAVLLALVLAVFVFTGVVGATGDTLPAGVPAAQETVPLPVATGGVPIGVATGEAVTGNPDAAPPGQNGSNPAAGGGTGTTAQPQGGSFPWLAAIIFAAVVLLGIIALLMLRSRRAVTAEGPALVAAPAPRTTTATTTTSTAARAPGAYGAAPAEAVATAEAAAPAALICPNCGTANQLSENFCHECGQDLRTARQQMLAGAAPPQDVVTDDMPYLETLDRSDEQLEYVLSRPRVVLGTAAGSDVVIGEVFQGHETVSPRHAELRKEGDSFTLVDLGSEHGTFVNDVRTGENLLSDGDEIRLGSVRFVFRVPQA